MAKQSIIEREKKRQLLVKRFASQRDGLKAKILNSTNFNQKLLYQAFLQKLPRNSSLCRLVRIYIPFHYYICI